MSKLLIAMNSIIVVLLVAYRVFDAFYFEQSDLGWGSMMILVIGLPSITAIAATMIRTSLVLTGTALATNISFFILLLLLGALASTGLAGMFGLIFLILPIELIIGMNVYSLTKGLRTKWAYRPSNTEVTRS